MVNKFIRIGNKLQLSTSSLYNIEPIGLGTNYCESLTSYLGRIAKAHCITVGSLINKVVGPVLNKSYVLSSAQNGGNRFYDGAKALNGVDKNAFDLVIALETLTTRRDLINLTFKKWDEVLTNRGLLKETLSWCPLCLQEFQIRFGCQFYPLLWYLKMVSCCLKHNITLINACPNCGKNIPVLHRRSVNGICPNCDSKLINNGVMNKDQKDKKSLFYVENLGGLISNTANLEEKLTRDLISHKIDLIIKLGFEDSPANFSKVLGVPKVTLHDWLRGKAIPTLNKLLEICFSLNITLVEFFLNEDLTLNEKPFIIERNVSSPKIRRKKLDFPKIKRQLERYLSIENPISMEAIASEIGVHKRTLYRNLPDLCKRLSKRYQNYLSLKSQKIKNELEELIKNTIIRLENDGKRVSQRNIEIYLSSNALLRENFAKEYLKKYLTG